MDLLVEALPVEGVWHPCEHVRTVEERHRKLPAHVEWVDEEEVPRDGHEAVVKAIGVLEVDC